MHARVKQELGFESKTNNNVRRVQLYDGNNVIICSIGSLRMNRFFYFLNMDQ